MKSSVRNKPKPRCRALDTPVVRSIASELAMGQRSRIAPTARAQVKNGTHMALVSVLESGRCAGGRSAGSLKVSHNPIYARSVTMATGMPGPINRRTSVGCRPTKSIVIQAYAPLAH